MRFLYPFAVHTQLKTSMLPCSCLSKTTRRGRNTCVRPSIAAILVFFSLLFLLFYCFYWFRLQWNLPNSHTPHTLARLRRHPAQIMAMRIHLQLMGVHRRIWWPGQCTGHFLRVLYTCATPSSVSFGWPVRVGLGEVLLCMRHSVRLAAFSLAHLRSLTHTYS